MTDAATTTPDWLLHREAALCPCGCIGKRGRRGYVEKTLRGGSDLLKQVLFAEDVAARPGLLQRIDPRVKLVTLIGLVVVAALVHSIPALAVLYALALALAVASALPAWFFVKRVWLFVPIFTGIVVLPATLSVVTPGEVVLTLWVWDGYPQGFTAQGLLAAGLVVSRVAVSISLVVLLTLTTPWSQLLAALRGVGVPRIFILVIGMTYRYIFHLLDAVTGMYEARRARSAGRPRHDRDARASVAATAGALVGKATVLSEEVHQAMTARGYAGDAKSARSFRIGRLDVGWAVATAVFAVLLLVADRVLGG